MFTGIIENLGKVVSLDGTRLRIEVDNPMGPDPITIGESIAVNGVCLTVIPGSSENQLLFDLSPETLARTSLGRTGAGQSMNLERAMRGDKRFGGHFVQGHVDDVAEFLGDSEAQGSSVLRFRVAKQHDQFLVDKGSIALDGISLTVVRPNEGEFEVWAIPHTLQETNLRERKPGDVLNVEFDIIAKQVARLIALRDER